MIPERDQNELYGSLEADSTPSKELINPKGLTRTEWEDIVLASTVMGKPVGELPKDIHFSDKSSWEENTLSELYRIDLRMWSHNSENEGDPILSVLDIRDKHLKKLTRDIKKGRHFTRLISLRRTLREQNDLPQAVITMLSFDITALYLLCCDPNRFLVGLKDGVVWKKISWDNEGIILGNFSDRCLDLAHAYQSNLANIGKREEILVPDNPVISERINKLIIVRPAKRAEELLEEAFYNQRYIVPPEGAEVRFRNAGDAEKLILIQEGNTLLGRLFTTKGDIFIMVDLSTARGSNQIIDSIERQRWLLDVTGNFTAEVYRDLVTAKKVTANRFRNLGRSARLETFSEGAIPTEERPQVTYIPRILRVRELPRVRNPYDGPPRPITPHRVTGHLRKRDMTEKHRVELLEFEKKYQIPVLKYVPTGFTFVRPFIVPADSGTKLEDLPIFIKKRIERRLVQNLEDQLDSHKHS